MKFIRSHFISIISILICVFLGLYYVRLSARDLVFMDYWRNIVQLVQPVMEGKCRIELLWNSSIGQRNFLQLFLLALNIKYLKLNCIWEVNAGILVMGASAILLYYMWNKALSEKIKNNKCGAVLKQVCFIPVILTIFNLNQWEILSLQFSFVFMMRILSYLAIFAFIDKALYDKKWNVFRFGAVGILAGIVICLLSQLYFPGMVIAIVCSFVFAFWLIPGSKKQKIKAYLAFLIPCVVSIIFYFWGISSDGSGGNLEYFVEIVLNGSFFLGILYMLVGSVIPQTIAETMSTELIVVCGLFLLIIIFVAVILYFHFQIYKKTWLPLLMAAYGIVSIPIIIYGRAGMYSLNYLTSSRYACETTLIWTACVFIFAYSAFVYSKQSVRIVACICMLSISLVILYADYSELTIAPYRGAYKDNLIQILREEKITSEEIALLQSHEDTVRNGIELLKKYQLNIYQNINEK